MKKVKAMSEVQVKTANADVKKQSKKAHVTLVKPVKSLTSPGVGCRPTGVQ
ncbi:MAG: hypothetical protein KF681_06110 [Bdellovibrionaceae bacterium]|nr:hypothetical protein [Pseudobdellovibrionaceae bacterium]